MKRLVLTILMVATLLCAAMGFAGDTLFGSLGDAAMKAKNAFRETIPSKALALEADGGNFRVYFFTPPDNPRLTCFVAAGTQKAGAACYPKAQ